MKLVKWIIVVVVVLLAAFLGITALLPKDYLVERETVIAAPMEQIFSQVVDLEAWQEWNPWSKLDPAMVIEFGPERSGPGAWYRWESEVVGDGSIRITRTLPPRQVFYEMQFEGYEDMPASSSFTLMPGEDGGTRVVWVFSGSAGEQFFARWMSVVADKLIGASYEKGLEALRERCEALHTPGASR